MEHAVADPYHMSVAEHTCCMNAKLEIEYTTANKGPGPLTAGMWPVLVKGWKIQCLHET